MRPADADLKSLAVFRAVVEHRGFAGASRALNLSHSAVSFHIRALEERLGFVVCRRGRRGFELTDRGSIAYERAKTLLAAIDDFDSEMGALRRTVIGTLRLGVVDNTITDPALPCHEVIRAFLHSNAGARLDVTVGSPEQLITEIANGEMQLGIVPETRGMQGLQYHRVHAEHHGLYCSHHHPLFTATTAELTAEAIAAHEFVVRPYANLEELRGFPEARVGAHASNMEAQAMFILSGRFLGYLPHHFAERWVTRGELRPLLPGTADLASPFCVVSRAGRPPLIVRRFIQELVAHSWQMAHGQDSEAPAHPAG